MKRLALFALLAVTVLALPASVQAGDVLWFTGHSGYDEGHDDIFALLTGDSDGAAKSAHQAKSLLGIEAMQPDQYPTRITDTSLALVMIAAGVFALIAYLVGDHLHPVLHLAMGTVIGDQGLGLALADPPLGGENLQPRDGAGHPQVRVAAAGDQLALDL